jgi:hypothetical protein
MCRDRFSSAGFPSLHFLDILFPNGEVSDLLNRKSPNLTERRDRRQDFRRAILTDIFGETVEPPVKFPHEIVLSEEIYATMERYRILKGDIELVIAEVVKNGPLFFNEKTGRSLAALRPRQTTYWVEYTQDKDGRFLIHQIWCHRMVVPGVPGEGAETPATLEGFARTGGRV